MRSLKFSYPGNFLAIYGLGVLIYGPSGVGKSSLSLELISRGHQFISDDITLFIQSKQTLIGYSPKRSLGRLWHNGTLKNINQLYGSHAVIRCAQLGIFCHLLESKSSLQSLLEPHKIVFQTWLGRSYPEYMCLKQSSAKQAKHIEKIVLKLIKS